MSITMLLLSFSGWNPLWCLFLLPLIKGTNCMPFMWSFSFLDSKDCCFSLFYQVKPWVKTSLAPGSGVVTKYLLQRYLYFLLEYYYCNFYYCVVTSSLLNLGKMHSDFVFVSTSWQWTAKISK